MFGKAVFQSPIYGSRTRAQGVAGLALGQVSIPYLRVTHADNDPLEFPVEQFQSPIYGSRTLQRPVESSN